MAFSKDRFTYNDKHFVEEPVAGRPMRFFPNRVGLLHELAEISKPVARALSILMTESRGDAGVVTERINDGEAVGEKTTVQAVSLDVMAQRRKDREQAINDLCSVVDERNRLLLGRLLMDSMRETFAYARERDVAEVEEFMDGIDIVVLSELIRGWVKANAKVFGAEGERMAGQLRAKLDGLRSDFQSEMPPPSDGSSSKTQSSTPSAEASLSTASSS